MFTLAEEGRVFGVVITLEFYFSQRVHMCSDITFSSSWKVSVSYWLDTHTHTISKT